MVVISSFYHLLFQGLVVAATGLKSLDLRCSTVLAVLSKKAFSLVVNLSFTAIFPDHTASLTCNVLSVPLWVADTCRVPNNIYHVMNPPSCNHSRAMATKIFILVTCLWLLYLQISKSKTISLKWSRIRQISIPVNACALSGHRKQWCRACSTNLKNSFTCCGDNVGENCWLLSFVEVIGLFQYNELVFRDQGVVRVSLARVVSVCYIKSNVGLKKTLLQTWLSSYLSIAFSHCCC